MYLILILGAVVAIFPFAWMLLTAFKTYGEHSQKVFWPAALTGRPYANQPPTQEIVVDLHPTDEWHGATASFSPLVEGIIPINAVSQLVAERLEHPLEVVRAPGVERHRESRRARRGGQ